MRLIDMQVSVNGTAPGGHQTAQAQALYTYRFLHDVDQARKANLQRQEAAQPAAPMAASLQVSERSSSPQRQYTNRVRKEDDGDKASSDNRYTGSYRRSMAAPEPQFVDFFV